MASTYLTRTNGTSTEQKIFTFSAWVKRSAIATAEDKVLMAEYTDGNNRIKIQFKDDDFFEVFMYGSGSTQIQVKTNRKFRDASAWYHIVVAFDTTQSTASNRVKLYVNGVQETSFSIATYPSQNLVPFLNANSKTITIGNNDSNGSYFDGSMSHIHFTDGTAYTPSAFGETDTTTGEWKIKTSPSVTYGTNGFFILKDGNTITDSSTNSNNFSLGGGTLTKTEDCPDNVFATLNPLSGSLSNNTLTQGNNTVETTSGWRWRPSTIAPSSGKYYAEFKPTSGSTIYTAIGVAPQYTWHEIDGETLGSGTTLDRTDGGYSVGYTHSGTVKKNSSTVYTGSSYAGSGDIIGVAMDLDNHKVYFSKNGVWQNSGDPTSGSTGTGAVSLNTTVGDWSMSTSQAGTTVSCNYGNGYFGTTAVSSAGTNASGIGIFEYDVPTGYTALSTKGLNL